MVIGLGSRAVVAVMVSAAACRSDAVAPGPVVVPAMAAPATNLAEVGPVAVPSGDTVTDTALAGHLAPDVGERVKRRAWVGRLGELRLRPEGPVVAQGPGVPAHDVEGVVVAEGARVGMVLNQIGFQVRVYVESTDLAEVVTRDVKLTADPDQPPTPDDVGIILHIGARPEVAERRGDAARVSGGCDAIEYVGWLPSAALGRVFEAPAERTAVLEAYLASDAEIFDGPRGGRLARFHGGLYDTREYEHSLELLGRPRNGFQKVIHATWFCTFRGWAKVADVSANGPGNDVWGGDSLDRKMCEHGAGKEVQPAGTLLVHAATHVVFARTESALSLEKVPGATDGRVCLPTEWGPLEVTPAHRR